MADLLYSLQLGNIFTLGERVRLGVRSTGSYQVRNFFGDLVAEGTHAAGETLTPAIPKKALGHFRLTFKSENGHKASTTFAILEPLQTPDTRLGVCTHFGQLEGEMENLHASSRESPEVIPLLALAGFGMHRDELTWGRHEPRRGVCVSPKAHRTFTRSCGSYGVKTLSILNYANRHYDGGLTPYTPEGYQGFAAYARQIVRRYGAQLCGVEVWNEYNGSFSKGPGAKDPKNYLEILKRTYKAVKETDPNMRVLAPAAVTLPYGWLERLFALGALDYLDAVSVHPYRFPRQPDAKVDGFQENLLRLDRLIRQYNKGQPKDIELTEMGYPSCQQNPKGVTERQQADYAVRTYALALAIGIRRIYWYSFLNHGTNRTRSEQNYGLIYHHNEPNMPYCPKPSYVSLAVAMRQLAGATFIKQLKTPDPIYCLQFEQQGDMLHLLWKARRGSAEVNLPAQRVKGEVQITDIMGRHRLDLSGSGARDVPISSSPLYIRGDATFNFRGPKFWDIF